jgi:tetratricopeptide (TPR) repeat protein
LDKLGRIKEGIAAYSRAIELDQNDIRAYNNKAYNLNLLGRYEEAIKMADQAIAILPTYANPYVQKGYSLHRMGRTNEGIDFIKKAIQINPDLSGAYFNLAIIDAEQYNFQTAINNLQKAFRLDKTLKNQAIEHPSFQSLKEVPQFKELIRN